jgi:hypothetical protein
MRALLVAVLMHLATPAIAAVEYTWTADCVSRTRLGIVTGPVTGPPDLGCPDSLSGKVFAPDGYIPGTTASVDDSLDPVRIWVYDPFYQLVSLTPWSGLYRLPEVAGEGEWDLISPAQYSTLSGGGLVFYTEIRCCTEGYILRASNLELTRVPEPSQLSLIALALFCLIALRLAPSQRRGADA